MKSVFAKQMIIEEEIPNKQGLNENDEKIFFKLKNNDENKSKRQEITINRCQSNKPKFLFFLQIYLSLLEILDLFFRKIYA